MLQTLAIHGYRSLRDLIVPLSRLNVITGANGSGKSSFYRALRLIAETARGEVVGSLAREGGLTSTLWAGPEAFSRSMRTGQHAIQGGRRKQPVQLLLGFGSDEFSYAIDFGYPAPSRSMFSFDPEIKTETIWQGPVLRPATTLVSRRGGLVKGRDEEGQWQMLTHGLSTFDSIFNQVADPRTTPEVVLLREEIRSWRFYDHFRTDIAAPARGRQVGTRTPILSDDGSDLAAALQTIREVGDAAALDEAVADAFPGAMIEIVNEGGYLAVQMEQHGLLRTLGVSELSDGTLRYLLWIAALLTARPPELLVLNEPETSLHPDLLPALARLIIQASEHSQIFVVSHARPLIQALEKTDGVQCIVLEKELGETHVVGLRELDRPPWRWPSRK